MIKKVISGGQTGADRAALDVAIRMDIAHGGWIPKGRKAEDGVLPEKYQLQEMPTESYAKRTERNVLDSDGTLILSHGKLTGGSALTRFTAKKHNKSYLHVDLNNIIRFKAVQAISSWIAENGIEVLNVAGSRASKDSKIYMATAKILETVFYLDLMGFSLLDVNRTFTQLPRTVDEAVDFLISKLLLRDKSVIANMSDEELSLLHPSLGQYIRDKFGPWSSNEDLMESCRSVSGEDSLHVDDASSVIIREAWKKLRETHRLRAVK